MRLVILLLFSISFFRIELFAQNDLIPIRPDSCFDFKLNYEFKQKPIKSTTEMNLIEQQHINQMDLLPYVEMQIGFTCFTVEEFRVKVVGNKSNFVKNMKIREGKVVVELGFTDDMKAKVTSHLYEVIVMNKKKKPINKIIFEVQEDGTFLVNNTVSGKF